MGVLTGVSIGQAIDLALLNDDWKPETGLKIAKKRAVPSVSNSIPRRKRYLGINERFAEIKRRNRCSLCWVHLVKKLCGNAQSCILHLRSRQHSQGQYVDNGSNISTVVQYGIGRQHSVRVSTDNFWILAREKQRVAVQHNGQLGVSRSADQCLGDRLHGLIATESWA
jgi:hypothetical protein